MSEDEQDELVRQLVAACAEGHHPSFKMIFDRKRLSPDRQAQVDLAWGVEGTDKDERRRKA